MRLVTNEYIWDVLNSAAVHVHGGSTTGFEAWLMNVPTINLKPGGYARFNGARGGALPALEWLDDTHEDCHSFFEALGSYLGGRQVENALAARRKSFLERWFHTLDGRATERQAAALADVIRDRSPRRKALPSLISRHTVAELIRYHLNHSLRREFDAPLLRRRRGVVSDFLGQRDKEVRQEDVARWVSEIQRLQGQVKADFSDSFALKP